MDETAKEWEGDFDPMADPEEQKHLLSVLDSFRSYRRLAHFNGTHVRRQAFYSLPQEHWMLLSKPPFSILDTFSNLDDLIDSNAELAEAIFIAGFKAFLAPTVDSEWVASIVPEKYTHNEYHIYSTVMDHLKVQTSQTDMEKARSCVNQFYREWSAEGVVERSKCFDPVVAALEDEYRSRTKLAPNLDRSELKVLVPGAGLGRLVYDVCRAGFSVEGNEISYHQLMASALILNHTQNVGQFKIAPFALSCSNHISRSDQFQTFQVPDVHPGSALSSVGKSKIPGHERMSMSTGDFCVLYSQAEYSEVFDAVATVFFVDTAPNIIRYIESVRNCLKPGGIWINLGPLLWHHTSRKESESDDSEEKDLKRAKVADAGIGDPGSVELTNEEVLALVQHFGFTMEEQECKTYETGYISNPRSMLQNTYRPSFWIARKK
ncbi:methyltransferas-like protein [Cucurbitaria berberidis CBS 394.84]|uniref:carnosine N-methyltransferase n=1 Tax=Cucurbitaria berberidis CBS 394.84 TaxID=1168544 RepID=A0A9P4L6W4_9PLEO|nr:methyltransferas-like protein [Cucurbitaria berberidis CBS 394.84]KAF1844401.1 methyltransferas-like protein [Cucurbitaria berberidis CBS 394.84]